PGWPPRFSRAAACGSGTTTRSPTTCGVFARIRSVDPRQELRRPGRGNTSGCWSRPVVDGASLLFRGESYRWETQLLEGGELRLRSALSVEGRRHRRGRRVAKRSIARRLGGSRHAPSGGIGISVRVAAELGRRLRQANTCLQQRLEVFELRGSMRLVRKIWPTDEALAMFTADVQKPRRAFRTPACQLPSVIFHPLSPKR